MKISVSAIRPNPHRNFDHNPVRKEQVAKLVESIGRTGFWDNIVVRKSPTESGAYELAYGHNRLAAIQQLNITEVDIPIRALTDWDMFLCMVDENNTQQNVTTEIVMENISVGANLLESYIRQSETTEQFAKLVKSKRSPANASEMSNQKFSVIRNSVLAGCGVGKDLLLDFVPDASRSTGVVSTVLEALYGEQRKKRETEKTSALKAAAEKAAAEQAARQAEQEAAAARRKVQEAEAAALKRQAEQKAADEAEQRKAEQEAKEAEKRAEKARKDEENAKEKADKASAAHRKAEEDAKAHDLAVKRAAREYGVDIKVLRSFSSPTAMAEFANLVKRLRIPADHHVACAEKCLTEEWSKMTMREKIPEWWDEASGEQGRRYKRMVEESQKAAQQRRYVGGDLAGYIMRFERNVKDAMIEAKTVAENIQHADPVLRKNVAANLKGVVALLQAVIEAAESVDQQQEKVIDQQPMLTHHNRGG